MKQPDLLDLLEQVSVQEGVLALHEAGAGANLTQRASKLEVITAAREWATTKARRKKLRDAIAPYLDTEEAPPAADVAGPAPAASEPAKSATPTTRARRRSPAMDDPLPNPCYVVFCRICGIKDMTADELGAAMQALADVCAAPGDSAVHSVHSSVYGRLLCLRDVVPALQVAESVLDRAAEKGVKLAVGVSMGRLEPFLDFGAGNVVGPAINLAARLAAMDEAESKIVLLPDVHGQATQTADYPVTAFARPQDGRVKRTTFQYHLLLHRSPKLGNLPDVGEHRTMGADAVVYDIVRFSEKPPDEQWAVVTELNEAVRDVLHGFDGQKLANQRTLWHSPAGDGGVLVFGGSGGDTAWVFARELASHCRGKVEIRLGVAHGQTVVIGNDLPVGASILRADALSAHPQPWQHCVDATFWGLRSEAHRREWTATPVEDDQKALLILRHGPQAPPRLTAPNADILELCPRCFAEVVRLAETPGLAGFLDGVTPVGFIEGLTADGALQALRDINGALDSLSAGPPTDALMDLLAALAPLYVPAALIARTRAALGIDISDRELYRGGVVEIGSDTHESADSIIRGAFFDRPCVWDWQDAGDEKGYVPKARWRLDAASVPPRGTLGSTRVDELKRRLQQTCRNARDFEGAMAVMSEWLYEGRPLLVLCDQSIISLLDDVSPSTCRMRDGTTRSFKELALFLHMCAEERTDIQGLYDRLCTIVEKLNRA